MDTKARILKSIALIENCLSYLQHKPYRAFHRDSSIQQLKEARTLLYNIKDEAVFNKKQIQLDLIEKIKREVLK